MRSASRPTIGSLVLALHIVAVRLSLFAQQPPTSATDSTPTHLTGAHVVRYPPLAGAVEHERYLLQGTRINGGCAFHSTSRPERVFPPDTARPRPGNSEWVVEYDTDNCLQIRARGQAPRLMLSPGGHERMSGFSATFGKPGVDSTARTDAAWMIRQLSYRQQAVIEAVRYVRSNRPSDLPSAPADSVIVDMSSMLDRATARAMLGELSAVLDGHVTWNSDAPCGQGLAPNEALLARARCGIVRSKYYIEGETQTIAGDTATVLVHVFQQPAANQSMKYRGYLVRLERGADGWRAPSLISITERLPMTRGT